MKDSEAVAWAVGFIEGKTLNGESLPVVKQLRSIADKLSTRGYARTRAEIQHQEYIADLSKQSL